jgi:hypothetical protein
MPTISQLPSTDAVSPADRVPVSQAGATRAVTVGTLLQTTQPAIIVEQNTLLGRTSLGPGGAEPITIGVGVELASGSLSATGSDHANFPIRAAMEPADNIVLHGSDGPRRMSLELLRGLFTAGENVAIDSEGRISATAPVAGEGGSGQPISDWPVVSSLAGTDLVAVSVAGVDSAISFASLLRGRTIDEADPAVPATDTDAIWVAQGSAVMKRQTLGALWSWVTSKLPAYRIGVVEISADTTLDVTAHNGRLLVCSQPVTLAPAFQNMGSGFECRVVNLSAGSVTLGAGIMTSSGSSALTSGQAATIWALAYSGGSAVYALLHGEAALTLPGPVKAASISSIDAGTATLTWGPPDSGAQASAYLVQYRPSGQAGWISASSNVSAAPFTVSGLSAGTAYDFSITAVNAAGGGPAAVVSGTTLSSPMTVPGQVINLVAGAVTATTIVVTWSVPASGGMPSSYDVQYCPSGTQVWTSLGGTITATTAQLSGLSAGTSYDVRVAAKNEAGAGAYSSILTVSTASGTSVTSIVWNVVPSGSYARGSGAIGVNAHVTPASAAVQFGVSTSNTIAPSIWVAGTWVNTDLWGVYVPTPQAPGNWYLWLEGTDGSCQSVYSTPFVVE